MGITWTTLAVFFITFLAGYNLLKKKYNYPPGPRRWPIIGNLLDVLGREKELHLFCQRLKEKYGPIVFLKCGELHVLIVSSLQAMKECTVTNAECFTDRPTWLSAFTHFGEHGIINKSGDDWRQIRRLAQRAMRDLGVGKAAIEGIIHQEKEYVLERIAAQEGKPFDPAVILNQAVANVITVVCFGSRFEYSDEKFQNLLTSLNQSLGEGIPYFELENMFSIFQLRQTTDIAKEIAAHFKARDAFVQEQIDIRREKFDPNNTSCLLDLYLHNEEANRFTDATMHRLVMDLFVAGSETTTSFLRWALLYMLKYPEVQQRCQKEIDKVVGQKEVSHAEQAALPYLQATITELLRISNVAGLGVPHDCTANCKLGGYDIPHKTLVILPTYCVHMDETIFSQPNKFKPERFLDDNGHFVKCEYVIPFGMGPRVCPGENLARTEILVMMTSLLQKFTFVKESDEVEVKIVGHMGDTHTPLPYKLRAFTR